MSHAVHLFSSSEMRRAAKISKEASLRQNDTIENTPIVFTPGAVE